MASDFFIDTKKQLPDEWSALDPEGSQRFRFFKARVHGRLHFIKTLAEPYKQDLRSVEALRKEFEIGYNLDHPNIARYLHFDNNTIFEEFIDGKTLRCMLDESDERLKGKDFISSFCRQLLEGVAHIHSRGVLHLDLKPENVMITRVGDNVKIIDFGCAYADTADTTQGFTLQYKAPEQGGGETNAYTDIYLIGKIIEELATNAGCATRWKNFVKKATAKNPVDRFKSAREAVNAIPSTRRRTWLYPATAVLLLGIPLGVMLFLRSEPAPPPAAKAPVAKVTDTIYINPVAAEVQTEPVTTTEQTQTSTPQTPAPAPVAEDITRRLDKEITAHIAKDFMQTVKPACRPDSLMTLQDKYYVGNLIDQVQARDVAYGNQLAARYPEHAAWIRNRISEVEMAQMMQVNNWCAN